MDTLFVEAATSVPFKETATSVPFIETSTSVPSSQALGVHARS